eukprot:534445_1
MDPKFMKFFEADIKNIVFDSTIVNTNKNSKKHRDIKYSYELTDEEDSEIEEMINRFHDYIPYYHKFTLKDIRSFFNNIEKRKLNLLCCELEFNIYEYWFEQQYNKKNDEYIFQKVITYEDAQFDTDEDDSDSDSDYDYDDEQLPNDVDTENLYEKKKR